jgi:hypothetical protein
MVKKGRKGRIRWEITYITYITYAWLPSPLP